MRRHHILRASLAAALLATAASAASAAELDPCKLVTPTEAQALLGVPVGQPQGMGMSCGYESAAGDGPTLVLTAGRAGAATAKAQFERSRSATKETTDVPGLGDEAYSTHYAAHSSRPLQNAGRMVAFRKGTAMITLTVFSSPKSTEDKLIVAGKAAAGRV